MVELYQIGVCSSCIFILADCLAVYWDPYYFWFKADIYPTHVGMVYWWFKLAKPWYSGKRSMPITSVDYGSQTSVDWEISAIAKTITHINNTAAKNIYSPAGHHRGICLLCSFFIIIYFSCVHKRKYAALITGQCCSLWPWGNTSQHLPALVRWKISICWRGWLNSCI